jgi:tRNA/rRNA methyltransferase
MTKILTTPLDNISIILCNTSHSGNIGSVARAMKTMGLYKLALVAPSAKIDDETYALSSNARDVVQNALIVDTLDEALQNTTLAYGLTSRRREFNHHLATPKDSIQEILATTSNNEKVAIVFGSERSGLTIEQVEKCNRLITIPGNPEYFSLNLAQAVQIMAYEIFSQHNSNIDHLKTTNEQKSSFADNQGILNHIDKILANINYYNGKNQAGVIRRLQNILHKANLNREEVDLIRGILSKLELNCK